MWNPLEDQWSRQARGYEFVFSAAGLTESISKPWDPYVGLLRTSEIQTSM